jgi:RHS repeat-associated protein
VSSFRHPSRSPLLRFISRALILAFVVALLPPASAHAARTDVQDLTRELPAPDLASIAATADPHPVLWLVAFVEGEDVQAWFVVPDPGLAGNYHRARWMEPSVGRFTGMDPWNGIPGDPVSLHKYLYASDDSVNTADPTGRFSVSVQGLVAASVLGAIYGIATTNARTTQGVIGDALWGAVVGAALYTGFGVAATAVWRLTTAAAIAAPAVLKGPIPNQPPVNLAEQLALEEAQSGLGSAILRNLADAPRLQALYGAGEWVKMQWVHRGANGANIVIHWFRNLNSGLNVEYKFK